MRQPFSHLNLASTMVTKRRCWRRYTMAGPRVQLQKVRAPSVSLSGASASNCCILSTFASTFSVATDPSPPCRRHSLSSPRFLLNFREACATAFSRRQTSLHDHCITTETEEVARLSNHFLKRNNQVFTTIRKQSAEDLYERVAKRPVLNWHVVDAVGGGLQHLSSHGEHGEINVRKGRDRQDGDAAGRIHIAVDLHLNGQHASYN
jgi:hypothetical protein